MRLIAARIWNEPAVAIGFATSAALVVALIVTKGIDGITAEQIGAALLPLVTSLGIRQVVSPAYAPDRSVPPDEGNANAERSGE